MNEEEYTAEPIRQEQVMEPPEGTELVPIEEREYSYEPVSKFFNPKNLSPKKGARAIAYIPDRKGDMITYELPDRRRFIIQRENTA